MSTLTEETFLLLDRRFTFIVQSLKLLQPLLVAFTLFDLLQFIWFYEMFCQPLAVAQAQSAQHMENVLK